MPKLYDRGQVVIPAEIRRLVGLKPGDHVVFAVRDDEVVVRKAKGVLEYVEDEGGIPPLPSKPVKEIMRVARDEALERKHGRDVR